MTGMDIKDSTVQELGLIAKNCDNKICERNAHSGLLFDLIVTCYYICIIVQINYRVAIK